MSATTTEAPAAPARTFDVWVRYSAKTWQRIGRADSEAAGLVMGANFLREKHLSGDVVCLPRGDLPGGSPIRRKG